MLNVLLLADLHLGAKIPVAHPHVSRLQAKRDSFFHRLADYFTHQHQPPHLVLIAGDVFDTHCPEDSLWQETIDGLKRLQNLGMKIITVPGNHDDYMHPESLFRQRERQWPGLLVTQTTMGDPLPLVMGQDRVFLASQSYDGTLENPRIARLPTRQREGYYLALLHGSMLPNPAFRCLQLDSSALLECGYDLLALGSEHAFYEQRNSDNTSILVYPGLTEAMDFDQPGTELLTWISLQRGSAPVLQRLPFASGVPMHTLACACKAWSRQDTLLQYIESHAASNQCVRILLQGTLAHRPHRLLQSLQPMFAACEVHWGGVQPDAKWLSRLATEASLSGSLARSYQLALQDKHHDMDTLNSAFWHALGAVEDHEGAS